jgi:hypothetical protein
MRASSQTRLSDRRRALLEQASVALRGHSVALWRLTGGHAVAELVSRPGLPQQDVEFDVAGLLQRWGRLAPAGSLWVGCRIDADHWHVAPVRSDPPEPPPTGIERRSPERLVMELAGFSLGALERIWAAADQATVYLCSALCLLDVCLARIRTAHMLGPGVQGHLLSDLAGVADAIDNALSV